MKLIEVLNLISIPLSDIAFMIAMLIVVMVSACFLGRYIVISKKMVIATIGILLVQIIFTFGGDYIYSIFNPEIYEQIENSDFNEILNNKELASSEQFAQFSLILSSVLNILVFGYAFVFYLIVYKEKKLLRAIESLVCLYLYYNYINTVYQYMYIYYMGGDYEGFLEAISPGVVSESKVYFTFFNVLFAFITALGLFFILYFGYYRKKRFYIVRVRNRILFILWLVIFSIFPGIPLGGPDIPARYELLSYVFMCMIPILGGIAPILLVMGAAEKSLRERNEYQESYLNAELEYIEQYKRTQTETRAFRHDIINNLSLTNMMLEEGRVAEASQHLGELLGNVKSLSPSIITGDEMLDCIVSMKADKMKEMGIDFSMDGVIDGGLHMKPMDVCSIFANALDNAIEAASKCEADTAPFVSMNIKRTGKFFIIKISNSALQKVDVEKLFMTLGYTSKKDTEHHGFGLRNIRQTVEEYDGLVKAESDDTSFALSIMIPRSGDSKEDSIKTEESAA